LYKEAWLTIHTAMLARVASGALAHLKVNNRAGLLYRALAGRYAMKIQDESSVAMLRTGAAPSAPESPGEASDSSSILPTNGEISWLGLFEMLGWDEV